MTRITALVLAAGLALAGCAGFSETEQRVATGTAGGAAAGAALGAIGGSAKWGAIAGAGAGALGGYVLDQHKQSQE